VVCLSIRDSTLADSGLVFFSSEKQWVGFTSSVIAFGLDPRFFWLSMPNIFSA
jgi:hypothetical protein